MNGLQSILPNCFLLLAVGFSLQTPNGAKFQQSDSLYEQYRKTESMAVLKQVVTVLDGLAAADPNDYGAAWRRARAYYSLGDDTKPNSEKLKLFSQAIDSATHAVALRADGVEGHYWLALADGEYGEAKGMFKALSLTGPIRREMQTVIRINPAYENGGAYLVLGKMDYELPGVMGGSTKRAIQEYQDGLKVAPANPLLKVYLAESYIGSGRKEEGRTLLDQVLGEHPSDPSPDLKDAQEEARKLYKKNFSK
ncbi:MAG TPA: TRAP transporter TatT component family protein [Blastocatellia bacterium]|nr:TRAP transporter TatT component family protein [Blastocatellia bacterium]